MGNWREVKFDEKSERPTGRGGAAAVALPGGRLLLVGGADRQAKAYDDVWLLEAADPGGTAQWTRIKPSLQLPGGRKLLPRTGATCVLIEGSVYIFGGQEPQSGAFLDSLLVLDTDSWELREVVAAQRPPARHSHVAGPYEGDSMIVFGGAGLRGPLNDVWVFSATSEQWRCASAELEEEECPTPREMHAGAMISEAGLFVHGGRDAEGAILDDALIFDGRAGRWVLVQTTSYPRCAHTATNSAAPAALLSAAAGAAAAAAAQESGGEVASSGGGGGSSGSSPKAGGGAPAAAYNVLLFGGFTGEAVADDLLQLTFLRRPPGSSGSSLRVELRPVHPTHSGPEAELVRPAARFAHSAAVLEHAGRAEVTVVGGVNQTEDLNDVCVWSEA